jgi:hypothetical protein
VAAAGLADVLVRDPNPLIRGRVLGHALDQGAVLLLDVADVVKHSLDVLHAGGEGVADLLELVHREDPGAAQARHLEIDPGAREGGCEQLAQLGLHRRDLAAEVPPGEAVVVLIEDRVQAGGRRRREIPELLLGDEIELFGEIRSFEQICHASPLS